MKHARMIAVALIAAGLLASCTRGGPVERETVVGGGLGAAAGAGIGEVVSDDPIFGAVAGGALGALASNLYGQSGDQQQGGLF